MWKEFDTGAVSAFLGVLVMLLLGFEVTVATMVVAVITYIIWALLLNWLFK